MKKILVILGISLLSCKEDFTHFCENKTLSIINKKKLTCNDSNKDCYFKLYLFDGKDSIWYNTNKETFNSYEINDTLPTLILTKTKKKYEIKQ